MSQTLVVFVREHSDDLIEKIMARLNERDMICEIHPNFSFVRRTSGYVPFKLGFPDTSIDLLRGREIMCGFEMNFEDLAPERKERMLNEIPAFGPDGEPIPVDRIRQKLAGCAKVVYFEFHFGYSFQFRLANLTSAILIELVDGVGLHADVKKWYDKDRVVERAWEAALRLEERVPPPNHIAGIHDFEDFTGWP